METTIVLGLGWVLPPPSNSQGYIYTHYNYNPTVSEGGAVPKGLGFRRNYYSILGLGFRV